MGMLCFVSGGLGDREMESMIMSLDASAHSAQDPYMTVEHLGACVPYCISVRSDQRLVPMQRSMKTCTVVKFRGTTYTGVGLWTKE